MKRAILGIFGLLLPLTLSSCGGDSAESYCISLQVRLERLEGVLNDLYELQQVNGQLTFDEQVEREEAASDLSDTQITMQEVGCF